MLDDLIDDNYAKLQMKYLQLAAPNVAATRYVTPLRVLVLNCNRKAGFASGSHSLTDPQLFSTASS